MQSKVCVTFFYVNIYMVGYEGCELDVMPKLLVIGNNSEKHIFPYI